MSTLTKAKADLKYWQKQLRLMDWRFEIEICADIKDMEGAVGLNTQKPTYQMARIKLLEPKNIPEGCNWGVKDIEVTLVHELLHTRFIYCISRSKSAGWHEEMAIEVVALALVANRRGISPEEIE